MNETKKDNKSRIIFLEHYLTDHSDKGNPVTTEELLDAYEKQGLKVHRNTIRDDLETLKEAGMVNTGGGRMSRTMSRNTT